jgi:rod shape determining protein RodA
MTQSLRSIDWRILAALLLLVLVGVLANYSTSFAEGELEFTHFHRQLIWSGLGLLLMLVALSVPSKYFQSFAYVAYGLGVFGLVAVLIFGASAMGARRWIGLGFFQFQASELAKLTTLLGLARFLSDFPRDTGRTWLTVAATGFALLPMGLVFIEPDLGTSLVFPMVLFCVLAWAGIPLWHLLIMLCPLAAVITSWDTTLHVLMLLGILALIFVSSRKLIPVVLATALFLVIGSATPMLWNKLQPYQQKRLLTFVDPEADPLGSAYQLIQSKIAVGSGGLTGKGFLNGTQTQLKFLPEGHTDFIFSAWGEEIGFLGTAFVVALLFLIFYRGIRLASRCHNRFYSLTAAGIVSMLAAQALTNLFMTVGMLPVTGLPLPYISYGGSSLLTWMMLGGILLGISLRWREY